MSIGENELNEMSEKAERKVLQGEVVDDSEYELDAQDELLAELKATRDTLRKSLIMVYFFDAHVRTITKREQAFLGKHAEAIENRLSEADEVIEKYAEEE